VKSLPSWRLRHCARLRSLGNLSLPAFPIKDNEGRDILAALLFMHGATENSGMKIQVTSVMGPDQAHAQKSYTATIAAFEDTCGNLIQLYPVTG
jgi:hypothetical protein